MKKYIYLFLMFCLCGCTNYQSTYECVLIILDKYPNAEVVEARNFDMEGTWDNELRKGLNIMFVKTQENEFRVISFSGREIYKDREVFKTDEK